MSDYTQEIKRRRTFAIISHPDAGKTTLTEKFLLYGGAINLAGSVKGKATARHAVSDWMEIEKERGISVTSSVLQFEYGGYCINILDTPGHQDFSEDTYRTLMAADSAVMVIDASKGVLFGGAGDGMIPPDTHNRTILIGMGGTGIKTINHIKGSIDRKLSPNWRQYIAFLGIDADWTEFRKAGHLTDAECVVTTFSGVAQRAQNEAYYPHAWRVFADHDKVTHLASLGSAGSGRNRLMGKMKIHDQQSGTVTSLKRCLRNQFLRQIIIKIRCFQNRYSFKRS